MSSEHLRYLIEMDSLSLDVLMKEYGKDVWNFAFLISKNRDMADDITQDVFLQAYRHVTSFRGEASVKTWLLKITRNISFNYRNTAFFRKVVLVDGIRRSDNHPSAEQAVLEREAANEIWKMVFDLPVKYREVIILEAKYELKMTEIADILGLSEGTVKSRLARARKKMSHMLTQGGLTVETS